MINVWLIAAGALVAAAAAAATAVVRRSRTSSPSLLSPESSVPPVSDEWLSTARGKEEPSW